VTFARREKFDKGFCVVAPLPEAKCADEQKEQKQCFCVSLKQNLLTFKNARSLLLKNGYAKFRRSELSIV
jgi:hypothetical protein